MAVQKDKKSKEDKVLNKNTIIINPQLTEASARKVVMSFGRMNPPTVGHEKLIDKVKDVARKENAKAELYLSHSQDAKKNPLSYDDKVMLAKEAFGSIVQKSSAKTIIEVMKSLDSRYDQVIIVVGADRVNEFNTLLNKYNGKEYTFDSIKIVSAGERDPDAEGVEGMSASKMREAALKGEAEKFKTGLPKKLQLHADDVYTLVRGGMKLSEESELQEYVLTYAQRQKRKLVMRRIERKMEVARERLRKRIADNAHLIKRARKKAIDIIRKKVAGDRGANYAELSPSEKIIIDQKVEKRKGAIAKIAARLLPKVRKAEMQRVALLRSQPASTNESVEESTEYYAGMSASAVAKPSKYTRRYNMMYNGDGTLKYDRRFRAFRNIVRQEETELDDSALLEMIALADDINQSIMLGEERAMEGLKNKAEKSGISYATLKEVYDRGVAAWETGHRPGTSPQQWGYARVNSFITGGKTRTTADADLAKNINEAFEEFLGEGVNDPSIFKAVFLAGGPGSGKSFIVGKTALTALGFKVINSDDIFERALTKAGLKTTPEDIYSPKGQEIRGGAKALTAKKQGLALNGRLGLVIDGTGKDYDKIEKQAEKLKKLGYEVAMIFVNTDLDTAKTRNRMRARSLPDSEVETMWNGVQKNLGKFQNFFGSRMYIIDNSEGSNFEGAVTSVYRKISTWAKILPTNPAAKEWVASARTVKEDKMSLKRGGAFEQVTITTPVIPPAPDELDDSETELRAHADRHIRGAVARAHKLRKFRTYHEEHGAGFEGTDKLVKKYKKDTPYQDVNEAFEALMEAEETEISAAQMKEFGRFVDRMFEKYKIDFEFTKHFGERMNDNRNSPKIKLKELADLIKKIYAKHGNPLKGQAGAELVVKDLQSDLNMPVVIKYDSKNDEIDIVAKTIMRKKNFSTPNPVVKY